MNNESEHLVLLVVLVPTFGRPDQDESTARDIARSLYHSLGKDVRVFIPGPDGIMDRNPTEVTHKHVPNLPESEPA